MVVPMQVMGFWPGLPRLWFRGDLRALMVSLAFGLLVHFLLVATFYWPLWVSGWVVLFGWIFAVGCSFFALIGNWMQWRSILEGTSSDEKSDALYLEAQLHYLRGDYFEAEAALHRIFSSGKQDVEAAILMVSILRRTRRWAQGIYCIDRLLLLEKSAPWRIELEMERKKIREAMGRLESSASSEQEAEAAPSSKYLAA